jgi:hypothetical protein
MLGRCLLDTHAFLLFDRVALSVVLNRPRIVLHVEFVDCPEEVQVLKREHILVIVAVRNDFIQLSEVRIH